MTYISNSKQENFLSRLIKSVDKLGLTPQFLIERKQKYNTVSGGILSILIFILTLLACIFFGKELYLKADPTVILSNSFDKDARLFNLTAKNFNFFIGVQGIDFVYYIDPTIYTLKIGINQISLIHMPNGDKDFKYNFNRYNLERCDLNKHFKNFKNQFETQDLENLLCLDQEKFDRIPLMGSFGDKQYQYLEFTVSSCNNETNPDIICQPKEVIDKKLEGGFFVINYIETIFDPKNFTNPDLNIRRDFYTSISNKYFKEITFHMKNVDYISDSGILMAFEVTQNFLQTNNIKEIYDFRTGAETFISSVFRLSNNRDVIKRKYLKLQDVLAQVGGFIKSIVIIVAFFNHFYSTTNFYIFLMNKLYAFDDYFINNESNINEQENNFNNNILKNYNNIFFNNSNKVFLEPNNKKKKVLNILNDQNKKQKSHSQFQESTNAAMNYNNSEANKFKNSEENDSSFELRTKNIINQKKEIFNSRNNKKSSNCQQQPKKEIEEGLKAVARVKEHVNNTDRNAFSNLNKQILQGDSDLLNTNNNNKDKFNTFNNNIELEVKNAKSKNNTFQIEIVGKLNKDVTKTKIVNHNYFSEKNENNNNICNKKINTENIKKKKENLKTISLDEENAKNHKKDNLIIKEKEGIKGEIIEKELNGNLGQDNQKLNEGMEISEKIRKNSEDILTRINTRVNNHFSIKYNFFEKFWLMFSLCSCSNSQRKNENRTKNTLHQQKKEIYERSYHQITEKFDAFKYLKIFDDVELIKNILLTEDQVNLINIVSNARHKYKVKEETPINLQLKSLRNIAESYNEIDMRIKLILKNTHLL
jgi:hypothetical protein